MRTVRFFALAALLMVASACGAASATSSPAAQASAQAGSQLGGATWQWVKLTDPTQDIAIENPASYTLSFGDDGTVAIKADCNNAGGTYEAGADGTLSIAVGPSTLVGCPPGSRGDEFLAKLGSAARYMFAGEQLLIELTADGGTLAFEAQ